MTTAATSPWRRLVPLAVAVLAVHLVLLAPGTERYAPAGDVGLRFITRTVPAPPAPVSPPLPAAVPASPAPQPADKPQRPSGALPAAGTPQVQRPPPARPSPAALPMPAPAAQEPTAQARGVASLPPIHGLPGPARWRYELTVRSRAFSTRGEAVLDWRHGEEGYEARLALAGPGYPGRVQRSTGRITATGLAPEYFSDRYRGEQATHFDRAQGRVVFSSNRPATAFREGMQDRLSVIIQLSVLLAADPARLAAGSEIVVPTAGTREAEDWIFRVEGEEDLDLPGGPVRALKLQRTPRREYDQKVELWFAPGMDYALVRLRLTNADGGTVEQRWASTDRG